jgi:rhamnosyltransferase
MSTRPLPTSTLVVLSRSEPERLARLAGRVAAQTVRPDELLIVWNGTAPLALPAVRGLPVRVVTIRPEEFGHGRTRTFALGLVRTEVMVLLSDDAWPADLEWNAALLGRLAEDERIAACYGRQIGGPDAAPSECAFRAARYTGEPYEIAMGPGREMDLTKLPISNASAAYRAAALRAVGGFRADLISGEDVAAAITLLDSGYRVWYEPRSAVFHSHNYPFVEQIRRTFDAATSLREIHEHFRVRPPARSGSHARLAGRMIAVGREAGSPRAMLAVGLDVAARALGVGLAKGRRLMPTGLAARISRQRWFHREPAGRA